MNYYTVDYKLTNELPLLGFQDGGLKTSLLQECSLEGESDVTLIDLNG